MRVALRRAARNASGTGRLGDAVRGARRGLRSGRVEVAGPRGREDPLRAQRHVLADPHQGELWRGTRRSRSSGPTSEYTWPRPARRARRRGRRRPRARAVRRRRSGRHGCAGGRRRGASRPATAGRRGRGGSRRAARSGACAPDGSTVLERHRCLLLSALAEQVDHLAEGANPTLREASRELVEQAADQPLERGLARKRAVHDLIERRLRVAVRSSPSLSIRLRVPTQRGEALEHEARVLRGRDEDRRLP